MKKLFALVCLTILMITTADTMAWSGRNAKLKDIPDRTWLKVCPYNGASETIGGSSEVPWAYDANAKKFVRVGGCTGGYTNSIVLFDLGTETTTTPWGVWDATGPADRPGLGCNRGICYDPVTKMIYEIGGGASSDKGVYGYWRGDLTAGTWTNYKPESGQLQAQAAADTANKVIVQTWRRTSGARYCSLYYPDGDSLVAAPVRPGVSTTEPQAIYHDWWPTMEYAPGLKGTMYFGFMWQDSTWGYYQQQWFTWLFDAKTKTWTDLKPTGLEGVPANYVSQGPRPVLSWDPSANVMLLHIASLGIYVYDAAANHWEKVVETNPQTLSSQMFDYDEEHNVHVLVDYNFAYDQDIWAFRYAGAPVSANEKSLQAAGLQLDCSPNPFQTTAGITYRLEQTARVQLAVYDVRGSRIALLVDRLLTRGSHSAIWNKGKTSPGLYFMRLQVGQKQINQKVIIIQ